MKIEGLVKKDEILFISFPNGNYHKRDHDKRTYYHPFETRYFEFAHRMSAGQLQTAEKLLEEIKDNAEGVLHRENAQLKKYGVYLLELFNNAKTFPQITENVKDHYYVIVRKNMGTRFRKDIYYVARFHERYSFGDLDNRAVMVDDPFEAERFTLEEALKEVERCSIEKYEKSFRLDREEFNDDDFCILEVFLVEEEFETEKIVEKTGEAELQIENKYVLALSGGLYVKSGIYNAKDQEETRFFNQAFVIGDEDMLGKYLEILREESDPVRSNPKVIRTQYLPSLTIGRDTMENEVERFFVVGVPLPVKVKKVEFADDEDDRFDVEMPFEEEISEKEESQEGKTELKYRFVDYREYRDNYSHSESFLSVDKLTLEKAQEQLEIVNKRFQKYPKHSVIEVIAVREEIEV